MDLFSKKMCLMTELVASGCLKQQLEKVEESDCDDKDYLFTLFSDQIHSHPQHKNIFSRIVGLKLNFKDLKE